MEGLGSGNEIGVVNDSSLSHVSFFFKFEFFVFFSEFFFPEALKKEKRGGFLG